MIINPDVNARKRDYGHLPKHLLKVTSIFKTIQGEGPFAGVPAIFVRLAGCNLGKKESCEFCDTYFELDKGHIYSPENIIGEAESLRDEQSFPNLVVLTGGEPFLQNPYRLIELFLNRLWTVQVETNGYFWTEELHALKTLHNSRDKFNIVVSPKVNDRKVYPELNPKLFGVASCLKILVDADPKSPYHNIPPYAEAFETLIRRPVYISPINVYLRAPREGEIASVWSGDLLDKEKCAANHRYAAGLVEQYNFRLSLQTHLFVDRE